MLKHPKSSLRPTRGPAGDVEAIARLQRHDFPSNGLTTIDLFCGAGGITEGFRRAGFSCLYGNDVDPSAIKTFAANHEQTVADGRPIEQVDAAAIRRKLGLRKGELSVLVGGPPCQGFSINAPERFLDDPRNSLFKHYVRFLKEFQPKALLLENVPGMLSLAGGAIFEQILHELRKCGYAVSFKILFAAHYGVPQERWRTIVLGAKGDTAPTHPLPTHFARARANFRGGRTLTFQLTELDALSLPPPPTVGEALADLPRLNMGEGGEVIEYVAPALSPFANLLRNGNSVTFNHFAAVLSPQNLARLKYVKPGGSWRDIPHALLPKGMQRARKSDHTKRYGRLKADGLSGTVLTKCDPHWGAVFLPDQDRSLTVREAARLQSFPDYYRFIGSRVSQYEQVGNAVPVLMAEALAKALANHLRQKRGGHGA
ncbi:MAG TPA: DNA cytosine methyltransferase [Methylomirabilota bacterium]|nr:DNA cytosine methyltransferase [Methylomirabilota bacterium]